MKPLSIQVHPITLCVLATLSLSAAATAGDKPDKALKPPVAISGNLTKSLLSTVQAGTGDAIYAQMTSKTAADSAVFATTAGIGAGVTGDNSTGNGAGVIGSNEGAGTAGVFLANTGGGIYAQTSSGTDSAITADAQGTGGGIYSQTSSNTDSALTAYGMANGGGVDGRSSGTGTGVYAESAKGAPIDAEADSSGATALYAENKAGGTAGTFNNDVYVNGTLHVKSCVGCTGLSGEARLNDGLALVRFRQSAHDLGQFTVVVTPLGDSRGLYVARKGSDEFLIRENQGGRSSLEFDYRVSFDANPLVGMPSRPPAPKRVAIRTR